MRFPFLFIFQVVLLFFQGLNPVFALDQIPAATDTTLDMINWAAASKGSSIISPDGSFSNSSQNILIDGITTSSGSYVGYSISKQESLILDLGQPRSISLIGLHLWDGDNRFYRYLIEQSLDGINFSVIVDRSSGEHRGVQLLEIEPVQLRYLRIKGTFHNLNDGFHLYDELLVTGKDSAINPNVEQIVIDPKKHSSNAPASSLVKELSAGVYNIKIVEGSISLFTKDTDNGRKTWQTSFSVDAPSIGYTIRKYYNFGFNHNLLDRFETQSEAANYRRGQSFTILIPYREKVLFYIPDTAPQNNRGSITLELNKLSGYNQSLLERVRDAMTRSVLFEQKEVAAWGGWVKSPGNRGCFGCHIQSQAFYGLNEAKLRLPSLPVDRDLEREMIEAYLDWQEPVGWVSPEHSGTLAIAQTSLWAWSASNVSDELFPKIKFSLFYGMEWLLKNRDKFNVWTSDYFSSASNPIFADGSPTGSHTSGNIQALNRLITEFDNKNFVEIPSAMTTNGTVSFVDRPVQKVDLSLAPLSNITAIKVTVNNSFHSNSIRYFIINEFEVFEGVNKQQISSVVESDESYYPWSIAQTIDGTIDKNTGWYPIKSSNQPRTGLWIFNKPVTFDRIRIWNLYQFFEPKQFVIEVTSDPSPTLSSTFVPLVINKVGLFLGNENEIIKSFKQAIINAAVFLSSSSWNFKTNTRSAAHTILALNDSLPFLSESQTVAAKQKISKVDSYLRSLQKPDGGWNDTNATTPYSVPYASGHALRALLIARDQFLDDQLLSGINYLLNTQLNDGSWHTYPIDTFLASTTWAEIALPIVFKFLEEEQKRQAINDLTARGEVMSAKLYWTPIKEAVAYDIYRRDDSTEFTLVEKNYLTTEGIYLDTNLANNVTYYYVVRWLDKASVVSTDSNEASATPAGLECAGDSPPIIVSAPVTGAIVTKPYNYQIEAIDPDLSDTLSFELINAPQGMSIDSQTGLIGWTPSINDKATYDIRIRVSDKIDRFATQAFKLVVSEIVVNKQPTFVSTPLTTVISKHNYSYRAKATDPNVSDVLKYQILSSPEGMQINFTTGNITWVPNGSQLGIHSIKLQVTDVGGLTDVQEYKLEVSPNSSPEITTAPNLLAGKKQIYLYDVNGTDADGDRIYFGLVEKAPDMGIDQVSGRIQWQVSSKSIGEYRIVVEARDDYGGVSQQSYILSVPEEEPPVIDSKPSTVAQTENKFEYQLRVVDPEDKAVSYSLVSAPVGMEINEEGVISWIPGREQDGKHRVVVSVRDAGGFVVNQEFELDVKRTPVKPVIEIKSPNSVPIRERSIFEQLLSPADTKGTEVNRPEDVVGTIDVSGADVIDWEVKLTSVSGKYSEVLARGTEKVVNQVLAKLDPTLIPNNMYTLEVSLNSTEGKFSEKYLYQVFSRLKLGEFTEEETDLSISLGDLPIEITRQYNSQDKTLGEFGYSWRLALPGKVEDPFPDDDAFPYGTRVYVTNAEGEREGFTFEPYLLPGDGGLALLFAFFPVYKPFFTPDPGVTDLLEGYDIGLYTAGGPFYGFDFMSYNPREYKLTTGDLLTYTIDQREGLKEIRSPNRGVISITPNAFVHSSGAVVRLARDNLKRITSVTDPRGKKVLYEYDNNGDLVSVTDQVGAITRYVYDDKHLLTEIHDPDGTVRKKNIYSPSGRLLEQLDAKGNKTLISNDAESMQEVLTDARGNVTTNRFDENGNLVEAVDALGQSKTFTYDANHKLTSVTDEAGNIQKYKHDVWGNEIEAVDTLGNTITRKTNELGQIVSETNQLGATTLFTYDQLGNLASKTDFSGGKNTFEYDTKGNLIRSIDSLGNVKTNEYDQNGRVTKTINPLGYETKFIYDEFGNIKLETQTVTDVDGNERTVSKQTKYNDLGLLATETDAEGGVTSYEYNLKKLPIKVADPLGNETSYEYDSVGNITKTTFADGAFESRSYDEVGNLKSVTDKNGNTTIFEYDALNRVVLTVSPDGSSRKQEYDQLSRVVKEIDEGGLETSYKYDALGRKTKTIDPKGIVTETAYDAAGNVVQESAPGGFAIKYFYNAENRPIRYEQSNGSALSFIYDLEGRLIGQQNEHGETIEEQYDAAGRQIKFIQPQSFSLTRTFDEAGNVILETDPYGNTKKSVYDQNNRLIKEVSPIGDISSYSYDKNGNLIQETDALGNVSQYQYDQLNRLTKQIDANGSEITFTYDALGNLASIKDPLANLTNYSYDNRNRLSQKTDPFGHSVSYSYDDRGNVAERVDRNGRITRYKYDLNNRVIEETWIAAGQVVKTITKSYDDRGNVIEEGDELRRYNYQYNVENRLTQVDVVGSPGLDNFSLNYSYDKARRVISVEDNLGISVDSFYASAKLKTRIWRGITDTGIRVDFGFGEAGEIKEILRFGDEQANIQIGKTVTSYDAIFRELSIGHVRNSSLISDFGFEYDANSRLTKYSNDSTETGFDYDKVGQLLKATKGVQVVEQFSYDANGNRTGGAYTTGAANQLLSDGNNQYTYDAEGNLSSKTNLASNDVISYQYDHRNRLVSVVKTNNNIKLSEIQYQYDVKDRRIVKAVDGETIYYLYDGDQVWAEYDTSGTITTRYFYGVDLDSLIAHWTPKAGVNWYLSDNLGTIKAITDAAGNLLGKFSYASFGLFTENSNPDLENRMGFTGREYDKETGLYYYRRRYYDPNLGRFISQDPLEFTAGDTNLYRYVDNSPTNATDPMGLFPLSSQLFKPGSRINGFRVTTRSRGNVFYPKFGSAANDNFPTFSNISRGFGQRLGIKGPTLGLFSLGGASIALRQAINAGRILAVAAGKDFTQKEREKLCDPKNPVPLILQMPKQLEHVKDTQKWIDGGKSQSYFYSLFEARWLSTITGYYGTRSKFDQVEKELCFPFGEIGVDRDFPEEEANCVKTKIKTSCVFHGFPVYEDAQTILSRKLKTFGVLTALYP